MRRLLFILSSLYLVACAPKLRSTISKQIPPLPKGELVVVLDIADEQVLPEPKIAEVRAVDNGFSNNCSYYENIEHLKFLARQSGANIVKITKHKRADKLSTCDRLWADVYKVSNPKEFETEIIWTPDRKLTWDDFKGKPDLENFPDAAAVTYSTLGFNPSSRKLFKNDGKLFVEATFVNHGSWVLPNSKTDYILAHEQIHFDITEIYSRMLRKAFSDANVTSNHLSKATSIFENIKKQWIKRHNDYDYETKHGSKKETQDIWKAIVEIELIKYELYKLN